MNRILVTGGSGQLGQCFQNLTSNRTEWVFFFPSKEEVNICEIGTVEFYVQKHQINTIINTAAYTQVDQAEKEKPQAYAVNKQAIENLLFVAKKNKMKILFFSTDYVFSQQKKGFNNESDTILPKGIYAQSKAAGESQIQQSDFPTVLIRTSWLFSPYGKNFVKTILRLAQSNQPLKVVNDQWGSPTFGPDLAAISLELLVNYPAQNEIFHFSNQGVTNWSDFAKETLKQAKINKQVVPISSEKHQTLAPRPKRSVLGTSKIQSYLGISPRPWQEALGECLEQLIDG